MKIERTADGSTTIFSDQFGDHYHSLFGAEQESQYVFIEQGLQRALNGKSNISILEVGMGTGLNVLLSAQYLKLNASYTAHYTAIEPFPLKPELVKKLFFPSMSRELMTGLFNNIHDLPWNNWHELTLNLNFRKIETTLLNYKSDSIVDLIYYDAFGPRYQPSMWDKQSTNHLSSLLKIGGMLVTYCAQGQFGRNLTESGFDVERLKGPPGKREMIRAVKIKE